MDSSHPSSEPPVHTTTSRAARQGEIILRKPWQRVVFLGGLLGCLVVVVLVGLFAGT
jgi:hypothetical protein